MSNSVRPHRWQPTGLPYPWDSPGKNTGVGCHFLLQCMKVKSESEVTQSCLTLSDPMDCSPAGSSLHGIFQARVLEWGAIAFSLSKSIGTNFFSLHKLWQPLIFFTVSIVLTSTISYTWNHKVCSIIRLVSFTQHCDLKFSCVFHSFIAQFFFFFFFFFFVLNSNNNLNSTLKSRDITLSTQIHIVKAVGFLAVMYRWESWTIK